MPNGYHLMLPHFCNLWSYLCSPRSSLLFFFSFRSWGGSIHLYASVATCVLITASFVCQSKILPPNCLLKMSRWNCTRDLTLFRSQTEHVFLFRGRSLGIIILESYFFLCYPHSVDNSVSYVQFFKHPGLNLPNHPQLLPKLRSSVFYSWAIALPFFRSFCLPVYPTLINSLHI